MSFFKNETMGKAIIMGMKTYDSLPGLLPGRQHRVLTRRNIELDPTVLVVHSIDELLERIKEYPEVYVIGGASVYEQALAVADRLCLTEVDDTPAEADVFFPDYSGWREVSREEHEQDEKHAFRYAFVDYVRTDAAE